MLQRKRKRRLLILAANNVPQISDKQEDPSHPSESYLSHIQPEDEKSEDSRSQDSRFDDAPFESLHGMQESPTTILSQERTTNRLVQNSPVRSSIGENENNISSTPSSTSSTGNHDSHEHSDSSDDEESVVDIELIYCQHCEKSYAPATYKKFCQTLDENGTPKCIAMRNKKRKVYNSAKVRKKIAHPPEFVMQVIYISLIYFFMHRFVLQAIKI